MTNLPAAVVQADRKLQRSADELMELRWHWTLDKTNPDRVGVRDYGRQVGTDHSRISRDANAWAEYLAASGAGSSTIPGAAQTPSDFRELANLNAERQEATKAVARTTGDAVSTVARHKRTEVDAVVNTARERAVDRGTTVEHEIQRAAEWRAKTRKAAEREQDERRKASTLRFVEIEGHIGAAMQRLRKILDAAEDVAFTNEERELLTDSLGKMRALLNLIDLRIAGETDIDWDTELQKLVI
jgi:hypothetical protein